MRLLNLKPGQEVANVYGFKYEVITAPDNQGFFRARRFIDGVVKDLHVDGVDKVDGEYVELSPAFIKNEERKEATP